MGSIILFSTGQNSLKAELSNLLLFFIGIHSNLLFTLYVNKLNVAG